MGTSMAGITELTSGTSTFNRKRLEETLTAYGFLTPAMLIFLIFLILPIAFAVYISFTDWNGISPLGQTATGSTGVITFTNQTDAELVIPAGTVVTTAGDTPIEFLTTE